LLQLCLSLLQLCLSFAGNFCLSFTGNFHFSLLQLLPFLGAAYAFLCWQLMPCFAAMSQRHACSPKRHLFQVVQVQVCQKLPCLSTFATGFYESHVLKEFAAFSHLLLCLFGCLNNTCLLCRSVLTLQWGAL